jgi:hypothetical protein
MQVMKISDTSGQYTVSATGDSISIEVTSCSMPTISDLLTRLACHFPKVSRMRLTRTGCLWDGSILLDIDLSEARP